VVALSRYLTTSTSASLGRLQIQGRVRKGSSLPLQPILRSSRFRKGSNIPCLIIHSMLPSFRNWDWRQEADDRLT
jgi:hypothetical protein